MALPVMYANSNGSTTAPGYIAWAAFSISYLDVNYQVAAGSTNKRFVWWRLNGGSPVIEAGDTVPQAPDHPNPLTDDDVVLFGNRLGVPIRIQTTAFVDGDLVVEGSIVAKAIATDAIVARHILAGEIKADAIGASAITATKIAAGAVSTDKLTVASVGDTLIMNGNFTDYNSVTGAPIGWTINTGATGLNTFVTTSGLNYMMFTSTTVGAAVYQNLDSGKLQVQPGQQYYVEATVAGQNGVNNWRPMLYLYTRDNNFVTTVAPTTNFATDNGGYGIRNGAVLTIPATTTIHYARVAIGGYTAGGGYYVTNLNVNRVTISARIADGAIVADKIMSGAVISDKIAAGAVTTENLTVASVGDNIILNGSFTDTYVSGSTTLARGWAPNSTVGSQSVTVNPSGTNVMNITTNTSVRYLTQNLDSGKIPVHPGEQYYIEATVGGDGTNANQWVPYLFYFNSANTSVTSSNGVAINTTGSLLGERAGSLITVPANNTIAYARVYLRMNTLSTAYTFQDVAMNRVQVSARIADGAIVAGKVAANGIIAGNVAAGAITTRELTVASVGDSLILNGNMHDLVGAAGTAPVGWGKLGAGAGTLASSVNTAEVNSLTIVKTSAGACEVYQDTDTGRVPAKQLQQYYIEATVSASGSTAFQWRPVMYCYSNANALLATVYATDSITTGRTAADHGIRDGKVLTVPNNQAIYYIRVGMECLTNGTYLFRDVSLSRVQVSARIADGAITADKIFTNAVIADKIDANAVTAGKVDANAIDTRELKANAVKAEQIDAGAITALAISGDAIDGKTITGSNFQTTKDPLRGIKITDNGIESWRNIDEPNGPGKAGDRFFAVLPNEGVMIAEGESTVSKLTVKAPDPTAPGYDPNEAQTSMGGKTELPVRGSAVLQAATQPPAQGPTLSAGYETIQFPDDGNWGKRKGWYTEDGTVWWTLNRHASAYFTAENWNTSTGVRSVWNTVYNGGWTPHAVVTRGNYLITVTGSNSANEVEFAAFSKANPTSPIVSQRFFSSNINPTKPITLSWDGSKFLFVYQRANDSMLGWSSFTVNSSTGEITMGTPGVSFANNFSVYGHTFGTDAAYSGSKWMMMRNNGTVVARNDDGSLDSANGFPAGTNSPVGFTRYGSTFSSIDTTGTVRLYTANTTNLTKYVTSTFARMSGTTVLKETALGGVSSLTMPSRTLLKVTTAAVPPNANGSDDPNQTRVYLGTSNVPNQMFYQGMPPAGSKTITLSSFLTAAPAAPTTSTFTATVPYEITAASGGFKVTGNSTGSLGTAGLYTDTRDRITTNARPIGELTMWLTAAIPTGWLPCNGLAVSRQTYSALFSVLGTNFGAGDGSTTFNVPDLRGRAPVGIGTAYPLYSNDGVTTEADRSLRHRHGITAVGPHGHPTGITTTTASNTATTGSGNRVVSIGNFANVDANGGHDHGGLTGVGGLSGADNPSVQAVNFIIRAL